MIIAVLTASGVLATLAVVAADAVDTVDAALAASAVVESDEVVRVAASTHWSDRLNGRVSARILVAFFENLVIDIGSKLMMR